MVTWVDTRGGKIDIYARLFDSSGNPKTSRVKVNSDNVSAEHWEPVIGSDSNGNYLIAWGDNRNEPSIYYQKFDSAGTQVGTNVKLSQDGVSGFKDNPALSVKENGEFAKKISLINGENEIVFEAVSREGKKTRLVRKVKAEVSN